MSYTINPNAKNKWARNAENTMDLSLETDASSVYLDNGRTLEQEIGEGSMVSNVTTIDTSMSKVIDGTLDGAYESCVFKGKSLVNVIGKITVSNNAIDNRDGSYTINKNTAYSRINIFGGNPMIKVNTPYYFTVIVSNGTLTNLNVDVGTSVTKQQLGSGKYLITLTEESFNIAANRLFWYQSLSATSKETVTIYPILVEYQQGMENWDIPYFTGLCDVKMPILRNVGKNLFDGKLEMGGYTGSSGSPYDSDIRVRSVEKIFLSKGTYTLSSDGATKTIFTIYDLNGVFKKEFVSNNSSCTITLNEDCMIHICVENEKLLNSHIQIEQGSNVTSYEDHKTNILRTSEEIVLREVNGVCDTYNPLTGEYVRRIGEIVLDGSENWVSWRAPEETDVKGFAFTSNIKNNNSNENTVNYVSDKFNGYSRAEFPYMNCVGVCDSQTQGKILIKLKKTDVPNGTISECKAYLQAHPITVQYELKTPITTIVESLTTPFAYQNGHIILESGYEGQSLLPTLEYSTVVNKAGQIENVAKTIQRQEKQLTMLEQMLIQNIINLDYNNTLLTLKNEMEEML